MMTLLKSHERLVDYTQHGKYAALLLAAISIWGIAVEKQSSKERWEAACLFICGVITLAALPVTVVI